MLSFVAHKPIVLFSGIILHLILLVSSLILHIFMVLLAKAVCLTILISILFTSFFKMVGASHFSLINLVLKILLFFFLLLLECLDASSLFSIVNNLLDSGLLSKLELAVASFFMLFNTICFVLTKFAAQMHLVVSVFSRNHFVPWS